MENENKKQIILFGETKIEILESQTFYVVTFHLQKDESEFNTKLIQNKIKAVCELAEKRLFSYEVIYFSNDIEVKVCLNREW